MTIETQYSDRLPQSASSLLHVRFEATLVRALESTQANPALKIKGTRRPSRSLIVRRAVDMYTRLLTQMTPEQLQRENLELHRLA